ncbi:MAG: hypothetical protein OEW75_10175 [Cyclobacteriaceae bacterium]|nr:hypothetical protein [Cyclobacteriaceae bacterium]
MKEDDKIDSLIKDIMAYDVEKKSTNENLTNSIMAEVYSSFYKRQRIKNLYIPFLYILVFIIVSGLIIGSVFVNKDGGISINYSVFQQTWVWIKTWVGTPFGKATLALILIHFLLIRGIAVYFIFNNFNFNKRFPFKSTVKRSF